MESPLRPPPDPGFRLIETFRWEPGRGILRKKRHLARLARSAAPLGIEPCGIEAALDGLAGDRPLRVRLTVDKDGRAEVSHAPFTPLPRDSVWRVAIAGEILNSDDPWLRVKTTRRALYDKARADLPEGLDELIFLNQCGELCEGTITNLFVDMGRKLLTPPVSCGLLPGILREEMLANGDAVESLLTLNSLETARRIFVGNSLRGLIPARLFGLANIRSRPTTP